MSFLLKTHSLKIVTLLTNDQLDIQSEESFLFLSFFLSLYLSSFFSVCLSVILSFFVYFFWRRGSKGLSMVESKE